MIPTKLKKLVNIISYMPWIGERSATKLAFFLLKSNSAYVKQFETLLSEIQTDIQECNVCHSLTDNLNNKCDICNNETRDKLKICVIEDFLDLVSIEETWVYTWTYHVIWGAISPINWVLVDSLNFPTLFNRVKDLKKLDNFEKLEIIIATNPNIEWEATALYIKDNVPYSDSIKVTRLSRWLPNSWYIEYADQATLINAFEGREMG